MAGIIIRSHYSSHILWAARRLGELAGQIEEAGGRIPRFDPDHRAYVVSSILASVAFLEAMINELYQDAYDNHGTTGDGYIAPLDADVRSRMREMWRDTDEGSGLRLLAKYQILLVLSGHERLDQGAQPYQDAQLLVGLRSTLAHYQPEDRSIDVPHIMEGRLKGKFPDNSLMKGSGNSWWPDFCLGHGCTEWGIQSARTLADRIASEIGIQPNYQRLDQKDFFPRDEGEQIALS
jgi:hypothetical protein